MSEYKVRMIVEGRSTSIRVEANSSSDAARLAMAQYAGSEARVIETSRIH